MLKDLEPCQIVKVAEELAVEIEAREIPHGFEPGGRSFPQILAQLRHEYTNYDDLLAALPLCVDYWDSGGGDYCDEQCDDLDGCRLGREAHWLLKSEANQAAIEVWRHWQHRTDPVQRKAGPAHGESKS